MSFLLLLVYIFFVFLFFPSLSSSSCLVKDNIHVLCVSYPGIAFPFYMTEQRRRRTSRRLSSIQKKKHRLNDVFISIMSF